MDSEVTYLHKFQTKHFAFALNVVASGGTLFLILADDTMFTEY